MQIVDQGPVSRHSDIFFEAVDATRMPMIITDPRLPDNPIIFANAAFGEMTGYAKEEVLQRNCRFLQGPNSDPQAVAQIREAVAAERDVSVELINYRKDGSTFWNALFVSPVRDADGTLLYFFASQLDVSRRRNAEDALLQIRKLEAIGQLTGGIAHDFNNLLQIIIGHLDRVKNTHADVQVADMESVNSVEQAIAAAERGAALTQQLLSFARRQRLEQRTVNMNMMVESISEMAVRTMNGNNIQFEIDLDPMLKNAKVDPAQTEAAFLNILLNARDAMPDGGEITIRTQNWEPERVRGLPGSADSLKDGHYVGISITDTGVGIDPKYLDRVTEPFFTTKDQGKGTGMGLASAYGYMCQSGGTLHIESTVGKGTTVLFLFPADESAIKRDESGHAEMDNAGKEVILLVEDLKEVSNLQSLVLREAGYTVHIAQNAQEALKIAEGLDRIDCLFSDIIMPGGVDGVKLADTLTQIRPDVRVLLTTGYSEVMTNMPQQSKRWPVLQKPYRQTALLRAIRAALDGDDVPMLTKRH